ncbi:MAG: RelA/SpoT family protein [Patescibacteria group bacterium]|jgi:guanosine-3',5'-bis(diphosphate) 3'-pyrophosphohydrolase|nr:RelA/SpoT family protein [Patescibacteria group bacterium]
MLTLNELIKIRKIPFDKSQLERISKAYDFAKKAHSGQKRKNGVTDYFEHCVETAAILIKMGLGSISTTAALLHDVPEDTEYTMEDIEKEFGKDVAFVVDGVTKVGKVRLREDMKEYYLENLRKMFLSMAADIRVVLIKTADRLHNMRTLSNLPETKRERIAKETMEIFVPIANRLGIGEIKGELEDLAFKHLDPENYKKIVKLEDEAFAERAVYVDQAIKELKKEFKKENLKVIDIHGRAKHYYSLFKKLQNHDMDMSKIHDLSAIRIIFPTVANCYEALGIVHKKYNPLIGRIKDYISLPKPNGYRSIHTTVFGPKGKILEIQIRTERMHNEAEYGIAAHWIYSEKKSWKDFITGKNKQPIVPDNQLHWISQLREWQRETGGQTDEFWASLKIDFFKNHIFAFTPKGDVIELPEKATPIDFAYQIHTEVGNKTESARINSKMVSLSHEIHNGDVVEVITSKENKLPNRDWLKFVKTVQARSKIKNSLKKGGIEIV